MTTPIPFLLNEDDFYLHPSDTYGKLRIEILGENIDKEQLKQQILSALKLQRLVEAEIDRIIHLNPHRISWYTRQQLLEKLLEESRGKQ